MGIRGPLSRHVGPQRHVVGVDTDIKQLAAARDFVHENKLANVEILELDAYNTQLPRESFDFTHVRFVFAPAGRDEELLHEILALTRPGSVIAIQEPDATSWNCYPFHPAWDRLKGAIFSAFARGGGDFNAGQRTFKMLRQDRLVDVQIRAAVLALQDKHPYKRLPIQFADSLRERIVNPVILSVSELDNAIAECEQVAGDPETMVLSFIVTQVWGRKAQ